MEAPNQEELKQKISSYYKDKLSSGLKCEVKSLSMAEVEETGGQNITATISFIHGASGESENSKVMIPCDAEGNLDWTNTKFLDEDEPHPLDPSKTSHPEVKSPAPLPANNTKPKDGGPPPAERGKYIQKPEKVGAQGGKKLKTGESNGKVITKPKRTGFDDLGWPTDGQLEAEENEEERRQISMREGYVHGQSDWGDDLDPADESVGGDDGFDAFDEAGDNPAALAGAAQLGEGLASPEGYVHNQDGLEEDMKGIKPVALKGEDIAVALIEYRAKSPVEGTETALFEFGVLFESEELRDAAKTAVEAMDGVEDIELLEDIGMAIVCRQDDTIANPAEALSVINEALGITMVWEDGHKDRYDTDLKEASATTHNYSDNKGKYRSGVQTDANEPGAANPGGGAQKPGEEQGGPKKRKHAKTSGDEGGDGLGGAKTQSTPSVSPDGKEATKDAGQQATESLEEQDFLDDVMSYGDEDEGDELGGAEDEMGGEMGGEALDDTILSLIAAQAEHGVEVVLQVAREKAEAEGGELTPEQEQEIRSTFSEMAEEGGVEDEEADVDITAVAIDGEDDAEDEKKGDGGFPFESKTEDVNINVNDGGDANVSAEPVAEPVAEPAPAAAPADGDTKPVETPDEGEETKVDGEEDAEDDADEKKDDDEKEPSEKPTEEEALQILRDEMIDELLEMEDLDAVLEVESLESSDLLALDERLPPLGEGGRFKKLKKELGDEGEEDAGGLAAFIGKKKYGKDKGKDKAEKSGESKPAKKQEKKIDEEGGLSGQASLATGWAAGQPAPNQPLSFVDNDAYSFAQRISAKDPVTRKAMVLKPGKFSRTTSRHANMVARNLARQGYEVDRVDAFDNDQAMKVGELDTDMSLGLPEESLIQLSGARFKKEAIEKLTDEQKGKMKEKLIARGKKLAEDQNNPNTMGGTKNVQRVQGLKKAYNMFGRLKPGVKWNGLVRVVWDDGNESWEKSSDIKSIGSNPYNVKSPSGGPTKPADNKMSKEGGEELDMLKNIESLKKLPREQRFAKAIEMQAEGKKLDLDKLVPILTEGWDEFDNFDSSKLVEAIMPKKEETPPEPEPELEPINEDEDYGELRMLVEDFGGDPTIETITDEDLDDEE